MFYALVRRIEQMKCYGLTLEEIHDQIIPALDPNGPGLRPNWVEQSCDPEALFHLAYHAAADYDWVKAWWEGWNMDSGLHKTRRGRVYLSGKGYRFTNKANGIIGE